MKVKVYSKTGEKKSDKNYKVSSDLSSNLVITEYINYLRANKRNTIAKTLDRSEVRGGGRKPWRQKGTGNARAGSNRSPIWSGGGVTFGPTGNEKLSKRLNKKVLKNAKINILEIFSKMGKLIEVEELDQIEASTKAAENLLQKMNLDGKITVITCKKDGNIAKSFRNLPYVELITLDKIDLSKSLFSDYIVMEAKVSKAIISNK